MNYRTLRATYSTPSIMQMGAGSTDGSSATPDSVHIENPAHQIAGTKKTPARGARPASVGGLVAVVQTAAGNMGHDGKRTMKKDAGPWTKAGVSLSWRKERVGTAAAIVVSDRDYGTVNSVAARS